MTPAVKALLDVYSALDDSAMWQEAEDAAKAALEWGIESERPGEEWSAARERLSAYVTTREGMEALHGKRGEHTLYLSPAFQAWVIAREALRTEEDAARKRIAGRLYRVDGATVPGALLLEGMADGVTFEEVFAVDALTVGGKPITFGGGAVPVTHTRRIQ